jgi:RNA polymerase sigma-70 factor (ECF subfamily)
LNSTEDIKTQEGEILRLLEAGDDRAVKLLYDKYAVALHAVIFRIVQSREIAEELLQETFVKIWRGISSYDPAKGRLYTWMLNIARNLAIDCTRSSSFKQESKTQTIENSVHTINTVHAVQFEPDHIGIKELTERLRPEQKELIDLIYFYGFTQAEAAVKLKIPLGTVKTRVRNAVSELRKYFRQQP